MDPRPPARRWKFPPAKFTGRRQCSAGVGAWGFPRRGGIPPPPAPEMVPQRHNPHTTPPSPPPDCTCCTAPRCRRDRCHVARDGLGVPHTQPRRCRGCCRCGRPLWHGPPNARGLLPKSPPWALEVISRVGPRGDARGTFGGPPRPLPCNTAYPPTAPPPPHLRRGLQYEEEPPREAVVGGASECTGRPLERR